MKLLKQCEVLLQKSDAVIHLFGSGSIIDLILNDLSCFGKKERDYIDKLIDDLNEIDCIHQSKQLLQDHRIQVIFKECH